MININCKNKIHRTSVNNNKNGVFSKENDETLKTILLQHTHYIMLEKKNKYYLRILKYA